LVLGVVLCGLLETIFFCELGSDGPLLLPFIWAYSQFALVELLVPSAGPPTWVLQGVAWFAAYLSLSGGLWALIGRSTSLVGARAWRRAPLGWVALEFLLAIVAAAAYYAGIIEME